MPTPENTGSKRVDYTGGDHSFKNFFKIMWGNNFIQLFLLFLGLTIAEIIGFKTVIGWVIDAFDDGTGTGIFVSIFIVIPASVTAYIAYKINQFWEDLKSGNSR